MLTSRAAGGEEADTQRKGRIEWGQREGLVSHLLAGDGWCWRALFFPLYSTAVASGWRRRRVVARIREDEEAAGDDIRGGNATTATGDGRRGGRAGG